MNLKEFSQKPIKPTPLAPDTDKPTLPVTIAWPTGANVAVPASHWLRDPNGRIIARYENLAELEMCLTISRWLVEWDAEPTEIKQLAMFAEPNTHHYKGD